MSDKPITTSWLWQAGEGVNGLKINTDRARIEWYDEVGCACGDSTITQTYHEFRTQGPTFSSIPDDVQAEVEASLAALNAG